MSIFKKYIFPNYNIFKIIEVYFVSLLFSLFLFFWSINFNVIELRFLILILIIPLLFNINIKICKTAFKFFIIAVIFCIHLYIQSEKNLLSNYDNIISIFVFFTLGFIFLNYKSFFLENLDKIIFLYLTIFFLYLVLNSFTYIDYYSNFSKICLGCFSQLQSFYKENSHLGIISPLVIYHLIYISKINLRYRIFFLFFYSLVCLTNFSISFFGGISLMLLLVILFKIQKLTIKFLLVLLIIFSPMVLSKNFNIYKITDFYKIKNDTNNKRNLSTEVYLASLNVSKKTLLNKPFGYGFNNYNEGFKKYIYDYDYNWVETAILNQDDGSITISKILTEFGIFTILLVYFLLSFFADRRIDNKIKIFFLLPLLTQLLIRGVGYFNSGFVLFLFVAIFIWYDKHLIEK